MVLETKYEPCETEEGAAQPNNGASTAMTGASTVWASGYTGAGSRVAIIDTGLDTDHQAVDNGAYLYAMADNAKFYTRLYPVGSSRNIDPEKYGHSRLQLHGGVKHVDVNVD